MSTIDSLHADQVYRVIDDRQQQELRFRSAMITSTALHTAMTLAILVGPVFIPEPVILDFTPVNLVQLQPTPTPDPAPAPVEDVAEIPEPEELEPPPPEDVPEDLEAQRRKEEEDEARRREEERRRREEEEARREAAEEARRRREQAEREEEERRRAPQEATRQQTAQQPQEITQQAERGLVGMTFGEELSQQDLGYLDFWIKRVLSNISNKWEQPPRPAGSREMVAVVHFRVSRAGQFIVAPDLRSTSGDRRYDTAAVRAVQAGQPFPPLPQAYRGDTLAINLAFRQ